jgi:hypothetical protein
MNKAFQEQFMRLANALSPENLHCDGEISRSEATRKYKRLMKEWHALEAQVGRKVTEYEIIGNHYARTY